MKKKGRVYERTNKERQKERNKKAENSLNGQDNSRNWKTQKINRKIPD